MDNRNHDNVIGSESENYAYDNKRQQSKTHKEEEIVAPLGTTADGESFYQDLSRIPHFLVCGFSGTGKTSFIQTVMTYMATEHSSEDIRFLIYDSKNVDYGDFNALPHLIAPVLTDERKAAAMISWLSTECKQRLKSLADFSTKDIISYNKQITAMNGTKMPQLFVILDDFSSIYLDISTKNSLIYVLKNGRPTGIHFIFVTSLTSSKVLQKDIMSNVPCRISFCVSTRADSRVAIEQNGAESLCVPGELIFRCENTLAKCQGVYMPDGDIQRAVKVLQRQSKKSLNSLGNIAAQIFDNSNSYQNTQTPGTASEDEDELFSAAVDCVVKSGQASISILQWRFKLGYARAARLVDMMEERGIVGPFEGSKPRQILITEAQWESMKCGDDGRSNKNTANENNRVAPPNKAASTSNIDVDEAPDIEMRDFAQFYFSDIGLCINHNQIKISNKVITKYGAGTATASFNGKSVAGLTYRKPRMFSRGYIQFIMKPDVKIINKDSHLITVTKDNLLNILKIEFDSNIAHTVKLFMIQIAQDTGIQLNEL